jgi:hypothetical protein
MDLHEWLPPLHEPPHVADAHLETHLWEPIVPPLHASLAPSQATMHGFPLIEFYIPVA